MGGLLVFVVWAEVVGCEIGFACWVLRLWL